MTQSKKMSFAEACVNTTIGYAINFTAQLIIFPMFNIHIRLRDNAMIGIMFTGISIARGYFLRRIFNRFTKWGMHYVEEKQKLLRKKR